MININHLSRIGLAASTSLTIAVLSTAVLSFVLGLTVAALIMYMCSCRHGAQYRKPSMSLALSKRLEQATTHSVTQQASEYQDVPVYQEITEFEAQKSVKSVVGDVPLMQNSDYEHIQCDLKTSTLEDVNENSDCVIFNPIYS